MSVPDPDEVLRSTPGKANFQRVARLLISGGTALLREIFDLICLPSNLPTILKNPATKKQLKAANLTKPQWDILYPSPGLYGKSADFDVSLLHRLLRTVCNLIPPATGWDVLPTSADHSLAADLARIKYYRNSVCHVNQNMEITDDNFPSLWQEISDALMRIAGQISHAKKHQWQEAIDNFLKDPLTSTDERNVQELLMWYEHDMEVKKSINQLKVTTKKGMEHLETSLTAVVQEGLEETAHEIETVVREEAQDIKDRLGELNQSLDRLNSSDRGPKAAEARLRLRIDCEANAGPGPTSGYSELAVALPESRAEIRLPAELKVGSVGEGGDVDTIPSTQDVMNLVAFKYLKTVDPSKPEDLNGFVYYLEKVRNVLIVDTQPGSLIITVECSFLEILDQLWDDYCTGYLNEMAQRFLVTEDILKELGLVEVKVMTTILKEEYRSCREYFLQYLDVHYDNGDIMLYSEVPYVYIVAIDFGTSFSGFAFAFNHKEGEKNIHMNREWGSDQGYSTLKTPTCLLLNPDKSFNSFGYEAQDRFAELDKDQAQEYYYFEGFKMVLHTNKSLNRKKFLKDSNGKHMKALEVFAHSIHYLHTRALQVIQECTGTENVSSSDVRWVLTVPAISKPEAKQFMREAAYQVEPLM